MKLTQVFSAITIMAAWVSALPAVANVAANNAAPAISDMGNVANVLRGKLVRLSLISSKNCGTNSVAGCP